MLSPSDKMNKFLLSLRTVVNRDFMDCMVSFPGVKPNRVPTNIAKKSSAESVRTFSNLFKRSITYLTLCNLVAGSE